MASAKRWEQSVLDKLQCYVSKQSGSDTDGWATQALRSCIEQARRDTVHCKTAAPFCITLDSFQPGSTEEYRDAFFVTSGDLEMAGMEAYGRRVYPPLEVLSTHTNARGHATVVGAGPGTGVGSSVDPIDETITDLSFHAGLQRVVRTSDLNGVKSCTLASQIVSQSQTYPFMSDPQLSAETQFCATQESVCLLGCQSAYASATCITLQEHTSSHLGVCDDADRTMHSPPTTWGTDVTVIVDDASVVSQAVQFCHGRKRRGASSCSHFVPGAVRVETVHSPFPDQYNGGLCLWDAVYASSQDCHSSKRGRSVRAGQSSAEAVQVGLCHTTYRDGSLHRGILYLCASSYLQACDVQQVGVPVVMCDISIDAMRALGAAGAQRILTTCRHTNIQVDKYLCHSAVQYDGVTIELAQHNGDALKVHCRYDAVAFERQLMVSAYDILKVPDNCHLLDGDVAMSEGDVVWIVTAYTRRRDTGDPAFESKHLAFRINACTRTKRKTKRKIKRKTPQPPSKKRTKNHNRASNGDQRTQSHACGSGALAVDTDAIAFKMMVDAIDFHEV